MIYTNQTLEQAAKKYPSLKSAKTCKKCKKDRTQFKVFRINGYIGVETNGCGCSHGARAILTPISGKIEG